MNDDLYERAKRTAARLHEQLSPQVREALDTLVGEGGRKAKAAAEAALRAIREDIAKRR